MKKLLTCALAIVMMISSVAFANESVKFSCEDSITVNTVDKITLFKEGALKVEAHKNGPNSTVERVGDPISSYGNVVKLTNPANNSLDATNKAVSKIVSYFQDEVDTNDKGSVITGSSNNVSFGFSFYAPKAKEGESSDIYININLNYAIPGNQNKAITLLQVKSNKIYSYSERNLTTKPSEKELGDVWHNVRFDIDMENNVVKIYIDDAFFYNTFFSDEVVNYVRYISIATAADSAHTYKQEAYFDNFFANETPESLFDGAIKGIDYGTCYLDDDCSTGPVKKINAPNTPSEGCSTEQLRDSEEIIKVTIAKNATTLPSFGSSAVSSKEGTETHVKYKNEEFVFELDVNFEDFNSTTTLLSFLKYNLDGKNTDLTTIPCMTIENGGVFKVGTKSDNMKFVTKLEKNNWYNFKFHYKPYNVTNGKNNGIMVDIYFMNELVAENLVISQTDDKHIGTIRNINVRAGEAPTDKARVIKIDNLKFYQVNKVEINPVQVADLEVYNENGDLISTNYESGINTFKAYVTATTSQLSAKATLVAVRYDLSNGKQLIGVDAVPAVVTDKGDLTEITAQLNITEIDADECIKVLIVDAVDNLTPYIKPVILTPSVQ